MCPTEEDSDGLNFVYFRAIVGAVQAAADQVSQLMQRMLHAKPMTNVTEIREIIVLVTRR
ncbi:hypothetical protein JOD21_000691 [Jeotgalibacillus terrae]|nr:hypothetical protein [Jeotgalibacillus terrae]